MEERSCFTQTSCLGEDLGEVSQLEYLSAHEKYEEEKNNWSEISDQGEVGEVKDVPLAADKVPPQISAGEGESGKREKPTPSVALEPNIPSLPPREKAQPCKHAEPSYFSSYEKPAVCTRDISSAAEEAETQLPVPEIPSSKNPIAGRGAAAKSSGESPTAVKWQRGEALRSLPGVSAAVQAGEAGSDGRAGFPASRSSSAQVCLCSRAVNTEITLMNKTPSWGSLTQTSVDDASNTELSFRVPSSHVQESEDSLCICDWKTGTSRSEHPSKPTGQSSALGCCPNVVQRAAEELQLTAVHYETCYQHCLKVFELTLEENTCFGSDLSGEGKTASEEPKQQERKISDNMDKLQAAGDQPGDSASPEKCEEQPKDQAPECEVKTVGSENEHSSVHVDGPKASVPEEPGENSLQKTSTRSSINSSGIFVPSYGLNLSSYTKLIRSLQERHPQFSREEIARAVREVRRLNDGVLNDLSVSSIEEKSSAILRSISSSQQGKQ